MQVKVIQFLLFQSQHCRRRLLRTTGAGVNGGIDIYDPNYVPLANLKQSVNHLSPLNHNQLTQQLTGDLHHSRDRIYNTAGVLLTIVAKKDYGNAWINIPRCYMPTFNTCLLRQIGDEFRVGLTSVGATPTLSQSAVLTINIGSTTVDFQSDQIFDDN